MKSSLNLKISTTRQLFGREKRSYFDITIADLGQHGSTN
jgi:hypothetical protein